MEFYSELLKLVNDKEKEIKELTFNSSFYRVIAISIREITEEDLKKEFEIDKIKHPNLTSYEKWLNNTNKWVGTKYRVGSYDLGYFLEKEEALWAVENNLGGMDEGGCYPYALIEKLPLNTAYPTSTCETEYDLFKFNFETRGYEAIDFHESDKEEYIMSQFDILYNLREE